PWPPTPTSPCWCTSGKPYAECHGEDAGAARA
ncbi:hypothetical protein EF912_26885, partial [Streptomyces sp. WAC07061]